MESTHGTKTLQRGSPDPRGTVGDSRLPSVQFETVAGGNPPVQHLHPTPQSGTLGAETWFTQMVGILTCQHRSLHVQKVTHTLAYLLRLAEAPNPLPQARNQVGGVADSGLWDVALPILDNGSYPDVSASLTTCPGIHLHLGLPYQPH